MLPTEADRMCADVERHVEAVLFGFVNARSPSPDGAAKNSHWQLQRHPAVDLQRHVGT